MKPTSITENVKLIVMNTVNYMVNQLEENFKNDTTSPVIKKRKRQGNARFKANTFLKCRPGVSQYSQYEIAKQNIDNKLFSAPLVKFTETRVKGHHV